MDINETVRQLKEYFREQMPVCEGIEEDWKIDTDATRFYFYQKRQKLFILDIDQDLLIQNSAPEIIRQLETAGWKKVLESHQRGVVTFRDGRFYFSPDTARQVCVFGLGKTTGTCIICGQNPEAAWLG